MNMQTLRDGSSVPEPTVKSVTLTLVHLRDANPLALYEAVQVARNPAHRPFGPFGADLIAADVVNKEGVMHDDVRHVILSAATGEDGGIALVNPVTSNQEG